MEKQGLLFIPDISGFTKFVAQVEIEHSRHIIQELLEVLIDANEIGLEVSEVEGDAILFYRFGDSPDMSGLYGQIAKMFCAFHRHLMTYEYHRLCQCKACVSAVHLSLKVITHYGEFTGYNVKSFSKLIGKDVIVAHQLLKNGIEEHEYWLVTQGLLHDQPPASFAQWMKWDASTKLTEGGEIPFHYTQLSPLKTEIHPVPLPPLEPAEKVKAVSVSKEFDADIKSLFYTAGHLEFRHRWQDGVKAIDEIGDALHSIGTRHRRLMDDGTETVMVTSGFSFDPGTRIIYSETDENKTRSVYFVMDRISDHRTRVTLDLYMKKDIIAQTLFKLTEKSAIERQFQKSLENLEELVKEIELPVEF
jgi:hypothetical protein